MSVRVCCFGIKKMKLVVLALLSLIGCTISIPVDIDYYNEGEEVDTEAVVMFSLVATAKRDGDLKEVLELSANSKYGLPRMNLTGLLASGGLKDEYADFAIEDLLPTLSYVGRSSEEQAMALLMLSNQLCIRHNESDTCSEREEDFLGLVTMKTDRGCSEEFIAKEADLNDPEEMCVCFEQQDPIEWISLLSTFSKKRGVKKGTHENEQTIAILAQLYDRECEGMLKNALLPCTCNKVNKGYESLMMQTMLTEKDILANISDSELQSMRAVLRAPVQRQQHINLQQYMTSSLAGSVSPIMLALLQARAEGRQIDMRELLIANLGFDASLTHILLNGGFDAGDADKVSLINYMTQVGQLDPTMVPLLLGVNNAQHFYLTSLIESGAVDPVVGLFLLARQDGIDNSVIMEILLESIASNDQQGYLESLYNPYVPPLPKGIYPGSEMYFAHFELLGVNTCALHDLRNRFECGYTGITAAQCEVAPYCCYAPLFITDVAVREATGGAITSTSAVPWCYYNIFFVLYNQYYMEVKRPGEFASPIQCRSLFKYGLKIDVSLYTLLQTSSNALSNFIIPRQECGFAGITEFHCVAVRGCCWDETISTATTTLFQAPQCYHKNGPGGINFDYSRLPSAYVPMIGSCNINPSRVSVLYYKRTACHYTIEFYQYGFNALTTPNRIDCITRLGCCYEDDEQVVKRYPFVPRCYKREGPKGSLPFTLPTGGADALIRSGDVINHDIFTPVTREDTVGVNAEELQ